VRCLGPVTRDRLDLLREADAVFVEEIKAAGLYRKMWQSFAVLLPVRSVGVMETTAPTSSRSRSGPWSRWTA